MEEPNVSPAENQPNADQRIAELESRLAEVSRRYAASSEEGKRLAQQVQQIQASQQTYGYAPAQANRPAWEQRLEESAIPIDALNQLIDARAGQLVQQSFEPIHRGLQARQTMLGKYKDYSKFESDVGELMNEDPEFQQTYNRVFQADPVAAMDYAYLKLGQSKRKERTTNGSAADESEAQIPTNRSGESRRSGGQGEYNVALESAKQAYRENPNRRTAEAYSKMRLRKVITEEFLNQ